MVLHMDRIMIYRVGLTGGIASGKSTVAQLFAQQGIAIIDADVIAREIVLPGQKAYEAIVLHFGDTILEKNGHLDRAKLKNIVFKNEVERWWLEALLHPLIRQKMIEKTLEAKSPYCILVIPLLIETFPYPELNRILVIDVDVDTQIKRLKERDHLDDAIIHSILEAQVSRAERLANADDVLKNEGDLNALAKAVKKLHTNYLRYSKGT